MNSMNPRIFFLSLSLTSILVGCQTTPAPIEISQTDLSRAEKITREFLDYYCRTENLKKTYMSRDFARVWLEATSLRYNSGLSYWSADPLLETQNDHPEIIKIGPALAEHSEIHVPVIFKHVDMPRYTKTFILRLGRSGWEISDILGSPYHDASYSLNSAFLDSIQNQEIWKKQFD
jgi:hypothetical protein